MTPKRPQFSLKFLTLLVVVVAVFAWSIHERMARTRAVAEKLKAVAKAEDEKKRAIARAELAQRAIDRVCLVQDGDRSYLLDRDGASIFAISRSTGQTFWELRLGNVWLLGMR